MNKLEYIPGDLVMTNGVPLGTAKDVVYRVTSSDPSKTLELDDGTVLKGIVCLENIEDTKLGDKGFLFGDSCAWVKDIVPIPLTAETFEKNGWVWSDEHEELTFGTAPIAIYLESDYFLVDGLRLKLRYVHQLQHLLFGLGINHEMKV